MKTIYSLVTQPINQNIAVIRISGPDTFFVVKKIFHNQIDLKPNHVSYKKFYDLKKNFIDEGLVLVFKGPNSFTGEDVVEFQFHGSLFIIKKIINLLNHYHLKQANPGEFMQQAYMNNKIDLIQSEAINSLIQSTNKNLADVASKNINGAESQVINLALDDIGKIISSVQVLIDYPENEDLPRYNLKTIKKQLVILINSFSKIIIDSQKLINVSKGVIVTLVGSPNAGKSTLLNAMLKKDHAIVSNISGTTRDLIEQDIFINGVRVTLQDTAGIRKTSNDIEIKGIAKTNEAIKNSDIVLAIIDGNKAKDKELEKLNYVEKLNQNIILVFNKKDLKKQSGGISISAKNNQIDDLLDAITKNIETN
ncbi:MAG: tRNA uridine-5-carboxymethylaminomethyl(34) synthesis GTPase MnmE, partial [Mycoplasmataceae bacterium]|nr:tRNA uridine-5-carboxymethylaminomethyl(34) synthesis GTPase MnmE [Mycoplasmataceae bacterium]